MVHEQLFRLLDDFPLESEVVQNPPSDGVQESQSIVVQNPSDDALLRVVKEEQDEDSRSRVAACIGAPAVAALSLGVYGILKDRKKNKKDDDEDDNSADPLVEWEDMAAPGTDSPDADPALNPGVVEESGDIENSDTFIDQYQRSPPADEEDEIKGITDVVMTDRDVRFSTHWSHGDDAEIDEQDPPSETKDDVVHTEDSKDSEEGAGS